MQTIIKMPKLSSKMEKGVIVAFCKNIGDEVKQGDILFEVETNKVVCGIEAPQKGIVKEILFEAGDEIPVDEPIMKI